MLFHNFFACYTISDKVSDCATDDTTQTTSIAFKKFSWEEIKKGSRNFFRIVGWIVGSGGFSTVYLAQLPDSTFTAVKIQSVCTERLARIHEQELQILLRLKHTNIVKLIGHCDDREEEGDFGDEKEQSAKLGFTSMVLPPSSTRKNRM